MAENEAAVAEPSITKSESGGPRGIRGRRKKSKSTVTASTSAYASAPATAPATHVSSSASSPKSLPAGKKKKKRRPKKLQSLQDFVPMGGNFSTSANIPHFSSAAPVSPPSTHDHIASDDNTVPTLRSSNLDLGQNRLSAGFTRSHSSPAINVIPSSSRRASKASLDSLGNTKQAAIEISDSDSDEEMEDSEGGMVVNLVSSDHLEVSDHDMMASSSDEEGEITEQLNHELSFSSPNRDSRNSVSKLRLVDLNPIDLDDQLRYAFYHLDRTRVDLHRSVICLACMQEDHMASDCPEVNCTQCTEIGVHSSALCPKVSRCDLCREKGHSEDACPTNLRVRTVPCDVCGTLGHTEKSCSQRFFPKAQFTATAPARLWISCCICASKSHLVGDCPDANRSAAARWSLSSLDPTQIINLSLETGTRSREREAENRGMRPQGLQIKGRASQHRVGDRPATRFSDDENEPFIRDPVRPRQERSRPQLTMGPYQAQHPQDLDNRYDRYDAHTSDRNYTSQNRGGYYATDSFGQRRRRSRSPAPPPPGDSWRPRSRRSPSPSRFDGHRQDYGPPQSDYWSHHPVNNAFDRRPQQPNPNTRPQAPPSRDSKTQLPTRKGSNPNLPSNPMKNNPSQKPSQANGGQGTGQKKKGKSLKSTGTRPT